MASTIRISILADAANAVRGIRNTGQAADGTSARLGVLKRQVDKVDGRTIGITVKLRGFAEGVAQIVVANLALDRLRKGMPDLSFGLTGIARKFTLVAAAALIATAATLPLLGATVAVGAALGAAGAGVALFGAVALPTIQSVTTAVTQYNTASNAYDRAKSIGDTKAANKALLNEKSALGALTPMQRAAALQVIAMQSAWQKLSTSAAPTVLRILGQAAGTLAQIIPKLSPAIDAVSSALSGISGQAFAGLAKAVGPFVTLVKTQGVPALKNLAAMAGNIAVTAGHLITAFAPLGNVILAKLTPLTAVLKTINFDSLAKSAGKLLPAVGSLLGNLGGALGNLVKAAAPLAGPVLQALSDIAGTLKTAFGGPELKLFVANIAKIVPAVAPIVAVVVPAFLQFAGIISGQLVPLIPQLLPLVKQLAGVFVNVLTGLSPLLGPLLGLVGILVTFLPILYPIITAFRDAMVPVVKAVGGALIALKPSFSLIVAAVIKLLPPIAGLLVSFVKLAPVLVSAIVPAIVLVAGVVGRLLTAFTPLFPVLTQVINAVVAGVTPVLTALGDALPSIVTAVETLVTPLLGIATALLPLITPVSQLAVALLNSLVPAALALAPVLVSIAGGIGSTIPGAIAVLTPLLSGLTSLVGSSTFVAFVGTVLAIKAGVGLWGIAQDITTGVVKLAALAQQGFQAVMNIGQLTAYIGGLARVTAATALQSTATTIAAGAQRAWTALTNAGQLIAYAASIVKVTAATALQSAATKAAAFTQQAFQAAQNVGQLIRYVGGLLALKGAAIAMAAASKVAAAAQWLLDAAMDANPIGVVVIAIAALVAGFILAYKHSETFRTIVQAALHAVAAAFKFLFDGAKAVLGWIGDHWKLLLAIITGPIGLIVLYVTSHWDQIRATIVNGFNAVVSFFASIPGKFLAAGEAIMQGLVNGIEVGLTWVRDKVKGLGALIPDWLKSVLGIHSPSTVGGDIGTNFGKSVGSGITASIPHVKKALSKVGTVIASGLAVKPTTNLTGLAAGVTASIKTGVSAAGSAALSITPPITGAAPSALTGGYTINVYVAPGADPAEAGRQTVNAIEAYERRTGRKRLVPAT